jgi:hypothetical protein
MPATNHSRKHAGNRKTAKLRAWTASLLRSRAHLPGVVYAPDEKSAARLIWH